MTLPPKFTNPVDYFENCVAFFRDYQHLFSVVNTDILVHNSLNQIDVDNFILNVDIFEPNYDIRSAAENCKYLENFFRNLDEITPVVTSENIDIKSDFDVPLSPKKRHEILYLARQIEDLCNEVDCDTVVDFGSGLGYLDQLLFQTTNFKVLGLECNESHYTGAKIRQRKYHIESIDNVKYIKHLITEDTQLSKYLDDKFGHAIFCITGLHACADLAVTAIDLFLKSDGATAMILMPCCYHKIEQLEHGKFKNFPLSSSLRYVHKKYVSDFMNVPFLRLAAQPPKSINDNLDDLVFNLLARAVLQVFANKYNCKIKRNKRKAVRTKTVNKDFAKYVKNAKNGFKLIKRIAETDDDQVSTKSELELDEDELMTIWREIPELVVKKVCIYLMLQNCMQPVIENFILYDRLVYLNERGVTSCSYRKIFNENISPRCLALVAKK